MYYQTMKSTKTILFSFLIIFITLEVYALTIESHYKYDIVMCMFLLVALFYMKNLIYLKSSHYFLFSIFLLIHCLGIYDFYKLYPLNIEYDYWVHGYFGFISILIIINLLKNIDWQLSITVIYLMAIITVLGVSALHELYEFAGAMLLGEGEGVLFIGAGDIDQWDTQKDMLNNLIGGAIGLSLSLVKNHK